jgi:DNA-binding beta-propeller fold protein YncE
MARWPRILTAIVAVLASYATLAAALACAADRVYWSNAGGRISYANLDGSGGGNVNTTGATSGVGNEYFGLAIDLATGKVYWANYNVGHPNEDAISYAALDGSGGGTLDTTGATVEAPVGVAIDSSTNTIYWANSFGATAISYAALDGSGGGNLNTSGATVSEPAGLAIDPAEGRVYWTNASGNKISYANLDGSGGGDLTISGPPTVNKPEGVAIDPAASRIYWADRGAGKISWASLDGSGGEDINTSGATAEEPTGVAVDPEAGRIYWGNFKGATDKKISYAGLDGTGGADLNIEGAIETGAFSFPALLKAPNGSGAPSVSGGTTTGSTLSCSQGSWAADVDSEFLFRAPQSYAYSWQRDGADLPGASGTTLVASEPGLYSCRVAAANVAGSASQTSAQVQVSSESSRPSGSAKPSNDFTIGRVKKGKLSLTLASAGAVRVIAIVPRHKKKRRGIAPAIKPSTASGGPGAILVRLKLTRFAKATLKRTGRLTFSARVTFTPTGGEAKTKTATLKLRGRRVKR